MLGAGTTKSLRRRDDRIIIHFDYDCFYASVFEAENPALKSLPLAVQQKQIIVTCNYEARRRGLRKLQLVTDAKRVCPDAIIVLGEDLTRFRDASKVLYNLLRSYSWSDKVERLGFDEVWMDVTDVIDYNLDVLNKNDIQNSFFHLARSDPTVGFPFDGSCLAGYRYPAELAATLQSRSDAVLSLRLMLGSHLARYLRNQLEEQKGYTSTVGISTSKLMSKLVGNVHKPKGQTTLLPPYESDPITNIESNITSFLDTHEIGLIPYIGYKAARKLREYALGHPAEAEAGLVYGPPKEKVTVGEIRRIPGLSAELLEIVLSGPGSPHGIGGRVFSSIHGIDNSEVAAARNVPRQISIEDSYIRLDSIQQVIEELHSLSRRLIERMRMDLIEEPDNKMPKEDVAPKWMAHPTTLRLSTRPRLPLNADGSRARSFNRISRSVPLPRFVFSLSSSTEEQANRLVSEALVPLFKKLHPETMGWNLSLVNVAVTGMDEKQEGTDIDTMFKKQQDTTREVENAEIVTDEELAWDDSSDEERLSSSFLCSSCNQVVPKFAQEAHERFHNLGA